MYLTILESDNIVKKKTKTLFIQLFENYLDNSLKIFISITKWITIHRLFFSFYFHGTYFLALQDIKTKTGKLLTKILYKRKHTHMHTYIQQLI